MTAAKYDLSIDQGSDFSIVLTISEDGSAKNLTNFSARGSMRKHLDADSSSAFECTIPSPLSGQVKMFMSHSVSAALKAGNYVYDLELYTGTTGAEDSVSRIMQGSVALNREVTR
jgi:hypothetical protein